MINNESGWWLTNPSEKYESQLGWWKSYMADHKKCSKAPTTSWRKAGLCKGILHICALDTAFCERKSTCQKHTAYCVAVLAFKGIPFHRQNMFEKMLQSLKRSTCFRGVRKKMDTASRKKYIYCLIGKNNCEPWQQKWLLSTTRYST